MMNYLVLTINEEIFLKSVTVTVKFLNSAKHYKWRENLSIIFFWCPNKNKRSKSPIPELFKLFWLLWTFIIEWYFKRTYMWLNKNPKIIENKKKKKLGKAAKIIKKYIRVKLWLTVCEMCKKV